MDKKILAASKDAILIGIGLVLLGFILQVLGVLFSSGAMGAAIASVEGAYFVFLVVAFFCLYVWAGVRAAWDFKMGLVDAGLVAAFSYLVASIVSYLLGVVALSYFWTRTNVSAAHPLFGAAGGVMMASVSIVDFTTVSLMITFGGIIVNFVVGAGGAAMSNVMYGKNTKK